MSQATPSGAGSHWVDGSSVVPAIGPVDADLVVAKLREISLRVALEYTLNVGRVVIHYVYGGDLCEWRSRGRKHASFRRLASHPELPMSPTALYRCVAIFAMCEHLGGPDKWPRLGVGHLRCALALPATDQARLLQEANRQRWSAREFESRCRALQGPPTRPNKIMDQKACLRHLRALARWAARSEEFITVAPLGEFSPAELMRVRQQVDDLERWVSELKERLAAPHTKPKPKGVKAKR